MSQHDIHLHIHIGASDEHLERQIARDVREALHLLHDVLTAVVDDPVKLQQFSDRLKASAAALQVATEAAKPKE